MGKFWKEYPIVGPEWIVFCLITSLIAIPIIYFSCAKKEDFWKIFGGFFFLTYVIGYFVVLVLFLGIGSNLIKIFGILPEEYFDLNKHGDFWDKFLFSGYGIWYLLSLIWIYKMGKKTSA